MEGVDGRGCVRRSLRCFLLHFRAHKLRAMLPMLHEQFTMNKPMPCVPKPAHCSIIPPHAVSFRTRTTFRSLSFDFMDPMLPLPRCAPTDSLAYARILLPKVRRDIIVHASRVSLGSSSKLWSLSVILRCRLSLCLQSLVSRLRKASRHGNVP